MSLTADEFQEKLESDSTFGECLRAAITEEVTLAAVSYQDEEDVNVSDEVVEETVNQIDRAVYEALSSDEECPSE